LFPIAAFEYGLLFYLEKEDWITGLEYLLRSAEQGCEVAYGYIGTILYLEKNMIDEAVNRFKKAEEAGCLSAPDAYEYGMLLIEERGETERGKRYLDKAADDGY